MSKIVNKAIILSDSLAVLKVIEDSWWKMGAGMPGHSMGVKKEYWLVRIPISQTTREEDDLLRDYELGTDEKPITFVLRKYNDE